MFIFFGEPILIQVSIAIFKLFKETGDTFTCFDYIKKLCQEKGFKQVFDFIVGGKVKYGEIKVKLKAIRNGE